MAFLATAPKCLVCLAAYGGLGAAFGLGGPEICGAPASGLLHLDAVPLTVTAITLVAIGGLALHARRRRGNPANGSPL